MKIEIKVLNKKFYRVDKMGGSYYDTPQYQTDGSAAMDLVATEEMIIHPGQTGMVNTGLALNMGKNSNIAAMIVPRSGLGCKGLVLANTVGLIDADYQGEIKVALMNRAHDDCVFIVKPGDRIAQIMFIPIVKVDFKVVDNFSEKSTRWKGGFGSTGV